VSDDSLAELDEITGNDIVATLARIVTGETQLETPNLQQAFAEANAGIRQANRVIGEYEMVDEQDDMEISLPPEVIVEPAPAITAPAQQALAFGAGAWPSRTSLGEAVDAGQSGRVVLSGQDGNSSDAQSARPEGKANGAAPPNPHLQPKTEKEEDGKVKAPPVPRPRVIVKLSCPA
jgi:hypothetical protein